MHNPSVLKSALAGRMKSKKSAPSAGMSASAKSDAVKDAKSGKDMGDKGKNFSKIADKATDEYGSKEAGNKVAGAIFWKKMKGK